MWKKLNKTQTEKEEIKNQRHNLKIQTIKTKRTVILRVDSLGAGAIA